MTTIHMTTDEAARDFAGLLARVRAGTRVVIDDASPSVELRVAGDPHVRLLSESLRLIEERGSQVTLDGTFGADIEAAVASHPEPLDSPWD